MSEGTRSKNWVSYDPARAVREPWQGGLGDVCPVDLTVHDDMTQCECPVCSMVRYTPSEGPQTLGVPLYLAHCVVVPWPTSQGASRMQEGLS